MKIQGKFNKVKLITSGTAGLLVSTRKHIYSTNYTKYDENHKLLTRPQLGLEFKVL